jgi:hypothetical protein
MRESRGRKIRAVTPIQVAQGCIDDTHMQGLNAAQLPKPDPGIEICLTKGSFCETAQRLGFKSGGILLANSEARKFRLTYPPSEGTEALSNLCGNLGFVGCEIGSPTVSYGF